MNVEARKTRKRVLRSRHKSKYGAFIKVHIRNSSDDSRTSDTECRNNQITCEGRVQRKNTVDGFEEYQNYASVAVRMIKQTAKLYPTPKGIIE